MSDAPAAPAAAAATTTTTSASTTNDPVDAKITIHWLEKSRSQRILWLLEELSLPYELKTYKRGSDMLAPASLKEIHPLGKSPVITVEAPGLDKPRVIAESAAIVEFIADYYGKRNGLSLVPARYKDGMEGKIGGETEEWERYRYYMHYAEGSLMSLLVLTLIITLVKDAKGAPFFIKPLTRAIGSRVEDAFLSRNIKTTFAFLESQLTADFWAGSQLSGADIMMIYPLESARGRVGLTKEKYPKLWAYVERIQARPAYQKAVQRIKDETGEYNPNFE